ncbi:hypothetical protein B0J14DRAFT_275695 [Halenospora varia]|nr:hypothetical protein B0J14DRAFT_275695 [Halenospora varia]
MDPLSASVACGSLLLTITRTTQMLVAVKAKYTEAPITIQLLMSELSTVKAALGQIRDWAEYNSSNTPRQKELTSAFNVSLEGCQLAMEALKEEVSGLVGDKELGQGSNVGMRIKLVWNEESIKDHSTRLRSQTQALQLLLQAVNWCVGYSL